MTTSHFRICPLLDNGYDLKLTFNTGIAVIIRALVADQPLGAVPPLMNFITDRT